MEVDPRLAEWLDEHIPRLMKFTRKMEGPVDFGCQAAGITPDELTWFRQQMPRLCFLAQSSSVTTSLEDPAIRSVLRRILKKTSPELPGGCTRWLGTIQGPKRDGSGGTPVISYRGVPTPARRLLWQLKYDGTGQALQGHQRLHNVGCPEKSKCMTLAHWYKNDAVPTRSEAQGAVRATLAEAELLEPSEARWCEAGTHLLPIKSNGCPSCARTQQTREASLHDLSFQAGRILRQQLRPQTPEALDER